MRYHEPLTVAIGGGWRFSILRRKRLQRAAGQDLTEKEYWTLLRFGRLTISLEVKLPKKVYWTYHSRIEFIRGMDSPQHSSSTIKIERKVKSLEFKSLKRRVEELIKPDYIIWQEDILINFWNSQSIRQITGFGGVQSKLRSHQFLQNLSWESNPSFSHKNVTDSLNFSTFLGAMRFLPFGRLRIPVGTANNRIAQ